MKTGCMEYDTVTEFETEVDAGDIFVVGSDGGIYNIIFKKQLLNKDNKAWNEAMKVYNSVPEVVDEEWFEKKWIWEILRKLL